MEIMRDAAVHAHGNKPGVVIHSPWQWNLDWRAQAAHFARHVRINTEGRTRVVVVAYSWGAGWGFLRFARELQGRGVLIDVAIMIDPVYRLPYLPAWAWWLSPEALTGLGKIRIPDNVHAKPNPGRVICYRQFQSRPMGRECMPANRWRTVCEPAREIECTHQEADDHGAVHARVAEVLGNMVEEVTA